MLKPGEGKLFSFSKAVLKSVSSLNKAAIQVYHPTRHVTGKLNSMPDIFLKTYLGHKECSCFSQQVDIQAEACVFTVSVCLQCINSQVF